MNLYYLSQDDETGYDTYDSCVVAADSEDEARLIRPDGGDNWDSMFGSSWARYPNKVKVTFIGVAASTVKRGVVCSSFNAG
jgi:hypothetical protein